MSTDTTGGARRASVRQIDWRKVAESYRDDLANLILVGNQLARGEAKPDEWHEAVRQATAAEGPLCVLRQGSTESAGS